jgi:thiamine pyrophosphate-dependent acetolactate synthase large subunit-like protein
MKFEECFKFMAARRSNELVITSAGHSGNAWWETTHDMEATFYLAASMSLSTMFASGLALACPTVKFWAFMGDGAFCMNPGALMVERMMDLPNLTHFLVSNRHYGATSNAPLPNQQLNDYATIARGMGLQRVFTFDSMESLERGFDAAILGNAPGHTFVVLELEQHTGRRFAQAPDGIEMKYRFGRHVEKLSGNKVFDYAFPK